MFRTRFSFAPNPLGDFLPVLNELENSNCASGGTSSITCENTDAVMAVIQQAQLKCIVLPKNLSQNARICSLAHPRTANPSRYYFCPNKGVFELTKIAAPKSVRESWLLGPQRRSPEASNTNVNETDFENTDSMSVSQAARDLKGHSNTVTEPVSEGHVVESPDLFVATPIDPLFLILPLFCTKSSEIRPSSLKALFLSYEDLLESLEVNPKHSEQFFSHSIIQQIIQGRMNAVCDLVQADDEIMYRININKLLDELISKAQRIVALGLPASVKDRFVSRAMDAPMVALRRDPNSFSLDAKPPEVMLGTESILTDTTESQSSVYTSGSRDSEQSAGTNITTSDLSAIPTEVLDVTSLLQLRTAISYMIFAYIPPCLEILLIKKLASPDSPINFKPLDEHLSHLAHLREEALASRSLSDFSRKRGMDEDDGFIESRAEKKRKKEEEEKRKKVGESRGVKDLKKVNVSGMKKMSDFFGKGVPAKKK